jgi:hypothetical protein
MSSAACTATPPPSRPCSSGPTRSLAAPATIVFNGDFHWLDVDPDDFRYTLGGIALLMGT